MILPFIAYLVLANAATYAAFAYDKSMARAGGRRVPERTLLGLALAGGSAGAVTAQRTLRHKTQKEPFRSILLAIVFLHVALVLGWAFLGEAWLIDGSAA
ncbi:hypothetical protein Sa4125_15700 [Aureimonas sp. SA4125]|uniref:DUF1294 domain-containing protein n=1 Tax=Aureimonas sp. SA4125 TaxID=2826993 RepID=UPI001CC4FF5F|nr:DUF1294 domain-containing protein [Aureimonas sp. SA4125]BDA84028.1 hypothetical protein Sa4125_15700 [Aureimonas sp. SA4125]